MQVINATDQVTLLANETKPGGVATKGASLQLQHNKQLTNGTGANQVNVLFEDQRTLGTGTAVANSAVAPTLATSTTTGSLAPGTYYVKGCYKNANGRTIGSAEASIVVPGGTSTNIITATLPALPAGATGSDFFVSTVVGHEAFTVTSASNVGIILALPATSADSVPVYNTTVAASETLNLSNASLLDDFGATITFTQVRSIYVENLSAVYPMFIFSSGLFRGAQKTGAPTPLLIGPGEVYHVTEYAQGWPINPGINDTFGITGCDPAGTIYNVVLYGNE